MRSRDTAEPARDAQVAHMFDPWLTCEQRYVTTIADNTTAYWERLVDPKRGRKLRQADRLNRDMVFRTVLANLAFAVASSAPSPLVGVSLRTAKQMTTRYERRGFRGLPNILDTLATPEGGGVLTLSLSHTKGTASTIAPARWLEDDLRRFRFTARHFGKAPGQESIILSRADRDFAGRVIDRELINYDDEGDRLTGRYRSEMERINAFLATAPIDFEDDGGPAVMVAARALRRCFNLPPDAPDAPEDTVRFDLGGRLFGGWWSDLSKVRRHAIRIEGEPIADLDFASMFLRLAYIEAGQEPPAGDLYAGISGLSEPRWRPGVKKVASAMLFRTSPLLRAPRGTRDVLPPGMSGPELRTAILSAHPALTEVFETGIGLRLMFVESQILVAALLALAEAGVTALPMHDGLMVARPSRRAAERIMGDAAETVTGHRLPTHCKD